MSLPQVSRHGCDSRRQKISAQSAQSRKFRPKWSYTEVRPLRSQLNGAALSAATGVPQLSFLSQLNVGETGMLVAIKLPESVQNHLMHMGFVPDARVTALRRAPAGDPTVYGVEGMEIALRHETADGILVRAGEEDVLSELDEAVR